MGDSTVKASVRLITPAQAKRMLENPAVRNRTISQQHVHWLGEQIANGKWQMTGEPIILDEKEKLLDGQHRLSAVVMVREPIRCVVVRGVNKKTFHAMGTGKVRSIRDVLTIAGHGGYSASLASALGWLYLYEEAALLATPKSSGFTGEIALYMLRRNKDLEHYVKQRHLGPWMKLKMKSCQATVWYLYSRISKRKADIFFKKVVDGANLNRTDPAYVLRQYMLDQARSRKRDPQRDVMAKTVIACRAHFEGRKITQLRWMKGESFPALESGGASHGERPTPVPKAKSKGRARSRKA